MNENAPEDARLSPLLLVADDYAFTAGVSRAIADLIARDRLSATGAMTNCPVWVHFASALADLREKADAGLHLNLTVGAPLGAMPRFAPQGELPSLGTIARRGMARALDRAELTSEIARQIESFAKHYGALPSFIDGHQHVHVLAGVRSALFAAIAMFGADYKPVLRDPFDTPGRIGARGVAVLKAMAIAGLATNFGRTARRHGFHTNHGFSGVSPFDPARDFRADFVRFLRAPGKEQLVMVHPGEANDAELMKLDPVIATRPLEWAYLGGPDFLSDLTHEGFRLARITDEA